MSLFLTGGYFFVNALYSFENIQNGSVIVKIGLVFCFSVMYIGALMVCGMIIRRIVSFSMSVRRTRMYRTMVLLMRKLAKMRDKYNPIFY